MKLSPSSAHQWVPCPGSVQLQEEFPAVNPDTTKSEEGREAHRLAESRLLETDSSIQGMDTPDEMSAAVDVYLEALESEEVFKHSWKTEEEVEISLLSGRKGVVDFYDFDPSTKALTIWDFKYGHTPVEVARNFQLFLYATSLRATLDPESIRFAIVQPRAIHPDGPVRFWDLTEEDYDEMAEEVEASIEDAQSDTPTTRAGAQCRRCTARHACGVLQKAGVRDIDDEVGQSESNLMTPQGLSVTYQMIENAEVVLKALKSGVKSRIEHLIGSGEVVPGYGLASVSGRLKWSRPIKEIEKYAQLYGVDVRKPGELVTPTQAGKAGLPDEALRALASRGSSLKLMKDSPEKTLAIFGTPSEIKGEEK